MPEKTWDEMTRDERILSIVLTTGGATRKLIAERLGLKKHKALHDQIETLVTRGYITRQEYENANHSYTFVYFAQADF